MSTTLNDEDKEQLLKSKNTIIYVIHNIAISWAILEKASEVHVLWGHIQNNLYDTTILHFIKMFYSNKQGELIHWKQNPFLKDHDKFITDLLKELEINKDEWDAYIRYLKNFRDSLIAHTDTNANIQNKNISHYPEFDLMLKACFFYHAYIMQSLKIDNINLEDVYKKTYNDTIALINKTILDSRKIC